MKKSQSSRVVAVKQIVNHNSDPETEDEVIALKRLYDKNQQQIVSNVQLLSSTS